MNACNPTNIDENGTGNSGDEPSLAMVQCEDCGHRLPEANMAVHRATCHIHRREQEREEPAIHTEEDGVGGGGGDGGGEAIEAVDESISGEYVVVASERPSVTGSTAVATAPPAPAAAAAGAEVPQNHWACPRCTLHNPITSDVCDACLYRNGTPPQNATTTNWTDNNNIDNNAHRRMHVNVTEVDPRALDAAGRAAGVAGWSLFGALVGGPLGALVAGGTAAAVSGAQHLQAQRRRRLEGDNGDNGDNGRAGRRPFFAVTTTSYTTTPWGGTTMSVSSNASGQRRTVTLRDAGGGGMRGGGVGRRGVRLNQMSPADRRILEMVMSNAVRLGTATPGGNADNRMTFEEFLQQLGFDDEDHLRRRRGATPELIGQCSSLRTLDTKEAIEELEDNQSVCNICLEEFKRGDEMRKLDHCGHTFHKECIDRWLSQVSSCPICKYELNSQGRDQQEQGGGGGSLSPSSDSAAASSS